MDTSKCPVHGQGNAAAATVRYVDFSDFRDVDASISEHPAGKGLSREERALLEATKWSGRMEFARKAYANALTECRDLGLSNRKIGEAVGKSEAAVRMALKRRAK